MFLSCPWKNSWSRRSTFLFTVVENKSRDAECSRDLVVHGEYPAAEDSTLIFLARSSRFNVSFNQNPFFWSAGYSFFSGWRTLCKSHGIYSYLCMGTPSSRVLYSAVLVWFFRFPAFPLPAHGLTAVRLPVALLLGVFTTPQHTRAYPVPGTRTTQLKLYTNTEGFKMKQAEVKA